MLKAILVVFTWLLVCSTAFAEIRVVDAAGRTVVLERPATRLVLIAEVAADVLNLLHRDPREIVIGATESTYATLGRGRPETNLHTKRLILSGNASAEALVAIQPDLVVISTGYRIGSGTDESLERLHIPYLVIENVATEMSPAERVSKAILPLATAIGAEKQGNAYLKFYEDHWRRLTERLPPHIRFDKNVLLEVQGGDVERNSFWVWGTASPHLQFMKALGALPLGSDRVAGFAGKVSPEYLLSKNPEMYIGLGGEHMAHVGGIVLGPGIDRSVVQDSLRRAITRPGLAGTAAVKTGNVHAADIKFWIGPFNIAAFEAAAKWLYPSLFADIEPAETLAEINRRFRTAPLAGTFWISLDRSPAGGTP